MEQLGIGLLGAGYMGRTYAECVSKYNRRGKLVAITGGTRAVGLAGDYGVPHEVSFEALLSRPDMDAVIITTPHTAHRDHVIQAASARKHALVEKPMATSTADCTAMIEACREAGVMLEVVKTLRFRGTVARAKQLIDEGKLGRVWMLHGHSFGQVYSYREWTDQADQGGASLDMGSHNFDLLRFLAGSNARLVFGNVTTYSDTPSRGISAMTQVVFQNGSTAQQWTSFEAPAPLIPDHRHRYIVMGEKGTLDIDGYGKLLFGTGDQWKLVCEQPAIDFINRPLDPARLEAFAAQTQSFIDDILDGRAPTVSGEDGRAAVEIVEASWRSTATGQAIPLPLST